MWEPGACLVCGDPTRRADSIVCGLACSYVWNPWRHRRDTLPGRVSTCDHCGEMYEAKRRGRDTYCSRSCNYAAKREAKAVRQAPARRVYFRECDGCGKAFTARRGNAVACSTRCRNKRMRIRHNEMYVPASDRNEAVVLSCKECGSAYRASTHVSVREFCSHVCGRRFAKRERRARKRAQYVEPVALAQLIARDRARCLLCGGPVELNAAVPDPLAPTVDHIVPISLGGEHSTANTQLAHFICNSRKGASYAAA